MAMTLFAVFYSSLSWKKGQPKKLLENKYKPPYNDTKKSYIIPALQTEKGLVTTRTVKILKIGTPEIITIIVLQLEQLDFTVQYCVQKMQTE